MVVWKLFSHISYFNYAIKWLTESDIIVDLKCNRGFYSSLVIYGRLNAEMISYLYDYGFVLPHFQLVYSLYFYRAFYLKRNRHYSARTFSRTKWRNQRSYLMRIVIYRSCSWSTAWNRHGRDFRRALARCALVTDTHCFYPHNLLPVSVLLSYSALPCQDTRC
jgi:hypothetical protein